MAYALIETVFRTRQYWIKKVYSSQEPPSFMHTRLVLLEDRLGFSTKLVELILLVLMFRQGAFTTGNNN
jgi:hypothetical protein